MLRSRAGTQCGDAVPAEYCIAFTGLRALDHESPREHAAPGAKDRAPERVPKRVVADTTVITSTNPVLARARVVALLKGERILSARHRDMHDAPALLAHAKAMNRIELGSIVDVGEAQTPHIGTRRCSQ